MPAPASAPPTQPPLDQLLRPPPCWWARTGGTIMRPACWAGLCHSSPSARHTLLPARQTLLPPRVLKAPPLLQSRPRSTAVKRATVLLAAAAISAWRAWSLATLAAAQKREPAEEAEEQGEEEAAAAPGRADAAQAGCRATLATHRRAGRRQAWDWSCSHRGALERGGAGGAVSDRLPPHRGWLTEAGA